jgi:hypothetical protein
MFFVGVNYLRTLYRHWLFFFSPVEIKNIIGFIVLRSLLKIAQKEANK